ncbi:MAG: HNH endonuclease [Pseudonocardiaceae bacterium]
MVDDHRPEIESTRRSQTTRPPDISPPRQLSSTSPLNGHLPCVLCGLPIDYELTRVMPLHEYAGTVHHIVGLAQGGDPLAPTNLSPAHRSCNCRDVAHCRQHPEQYQSARNSRRR